MEVIRFLQSEGIASKGTPPVFRHKLAWHVTIYDVGKHNGTQVYGRCHRRIFRLTRARFGSPAHPRPRDDQWLPLIGGLGKS